MAMWRCEWWKYQFSACADIHSLVLSTFASAAVLLTRRDNSPCFNDACVRSPHTISTVETWNNLIRSYNCADICAQLRRKGLGDVKSSRSVAPDLLQQVEQTPVPVWPEQTTRSMPPLEQNTVPLRSELLNFGTPTQEIFMPLRDISNAAGIASHSDILQCLTACCSRRTLPLVWP